jgi:hypothetical protein
MDTKESAFTASPLEERCMLDERRRLKKTEEDWSVNQQSEIISFTLEWLLLV